MQVSIGTHNLGVVEASVADTADYDLILGFTELRRLKPTIRWDTGQLEFKIQEQDRPPKRPPEAARAGGLTMKRPTLHGNEFVSAERILQAALEDGPIGFMLLEEPPSSLPAFGFVPTGADNGVEMEVEVDKVGDMVYINRRNWKTRRPTPKLDTWFAGPYPVQERIGRRAYRITLPANLRVHDVFHVPMLEPARTSSLSWAGMLKKQEGHWFIWKEHRYRRSSRYQ
ncbi:uncharacterized protein UHOD_12157 [Ustilago sp. UG-2017b]|nr:uncharacterized protein UHOD_12157 [Ustilago sp. UG-2017b]